MYDDLIDKLSDRFQVISLDMPGSGGSAALAPNTSYESIARCFLEVLETVTQSPINLYGIHTGNKIGAAMVAMAPERFRRFVFAGQSHSIIPDQAARNAAIASTVSEVVAPRSDLGQAALLDWTTKLSDVFTQGLARNSLSRILAEGDYDAPLARVIDELQAMRSRPYLYAGNFAYDLGRDLARLRVPTLIIEIATPEEDAEHGRQGDALLALIPGSRLITLAEPTGHGLTMEHRSEEIASVISDFFG